MSKFTREIRYVVIKIKDADKYLTPSDRDTLLRLSRKCSLGRIADGKRPLECICVESDWPEYDPTWKAIEARVARDERSEPWCTEEEFQLAADLVGTEPERNAAAVEAIRKHVARQLART